LRPSCFVCKNRYRKKTVQHNKNYLLSVTQYYYQLHSTIICYTVLLSVTQYYYQLHSTIICYTVLLSVTQYYYQLHSTITSYTVLLSVTQYYYQLHSTIICYTVLLSVTQYFYLLHNATSFDPTLGHYQSKEQKFGDMKCTWKCLTGSRSVYMNLDIYLYIYISTSNEKRTCLWETPSGGAISVGSCTVFSGSVCGEVGLPYGGRMVLWLCHLV
jgi:hypothetical protein